MSRLAQFLDPRFWVMAMIGAGALAVLLVLIAASQSPDARPAETAEKAGKRLAGFTATFPPRAVPTYPLAGPNGNTTLLRLKGRIGIVVFGRSGCAGCDTVAASLGQLEKTVDDLGLSIGTVSLTGGQSVQDDIFLSKNSNFLSMVDRIGSYDAYIKRANSAPVSIVYDLKGNQELGRVIGVVDWSSPEAVELVGSLLRETM